VVLLPTGEWIVDEVMFSIECGGLLPGESRLIPG